MRNLKTLFTRKFDKSNILKRFFNEVWMEQNCMEVLLTYAKGPSLTQKGHIYEVLL